MTSRTGTTNAGINGTLVVMRIKPILMCLAMVVCAPSALGQDGSAETPAIESRAQWSSLIDLDASASLRTRFDTLGAMQVTRAGATWQLNGQLDQTHILSVTSRYESSLYDITGATGLSPDGDVIDIAHQLSATAMYTTIVDREWSWTIGAIGSLGFEHGAGAGDAFTGGGFLIARQQVSEGFAWMGGLGVITRLEDDALLFPYIGIDWTISDTLRLHSEGTTFRLDASIREDMTLYTAIGWSTREFRLDNAGSIAGGVFQENVWNWSLGLEGGLSRGTWRIEAGITLSHRVEMFNSSGTSIAIADADPTGYVGLGMSVPF
ncbi:MAG: hypothetical protein ACYTF7_01375 [Planctomycetota bacterium]